MNIEADAVLFDLNGVLANSNPAVEHAWRVWARENGLNAEEIVAWSHGRLNSEVIEAAKRAGARVVALLTTFPRAALSAADAILPDYRDVRAEGTPNGVRMYINQPPP